jgi:hypothetical protein
MRLQRPWREGCCFALCIMLAAACGFVTTRDVMADLGLTK